MKKQIIMIGIVALLICIGLSGCQEVTNSYPKEDKSDGNSSNGFFTLSGTITNNYNKIIELDMAIVVGDFEYEIYETKKLSYLETKQYNFKITSGHPDYLFQIQVFLLDNTPEYFLDDFKFTNPSGNDMIYNVNINEEGIVHIT